jgi:MerR family regulatory protein
VGVQTLHYYERLGLLPKPKRSAANYRLYSPETIRRVRFVKKAQAASRIMEHFYFIKSVSSLMIYIIGALELTVLLGFVAGLAKKWTYGLVLLFHAVSTLSSYKQYLHPLVAPKYFVLRCLANARRVFRTLLSARSRYALERSSQARLSSQSPLQHQQEVSFLKSLPSDAGLLADGRLRRTWHVWKRIMRSGE